MKLVHKWVLLGLVIGTAMLGVAAQNRATPKQINTFVAENGSFQLNYASDLVLCKSTAEDQSTVWTPESSCMAYISVCQDMADTGAGDVRPLACIAYPAERYKGYNFSAAAFSVGEVTPAVTEATCFTAKLPPESAWEKSWKETINGVVFKAVHSGGAAASHSTDQYRYRSFHDGKCYQLMITIATTAFGVYDTGTVKEFTTADERKVYSRLKSTLDSFRFLK